MCVQDDANLMIISASTLGMMSDEEKKSQRIEDIRELLS
jgi:hypothetical protein